MIIQDICHKNGLNFNYKDRLPSDLCSSLVYRYSCARCAGKYLGSTTEHNGKIHHTGIPQASPKIKLHAEQRRLSVDDNNFKIFSG